MKLGSRSLIITAVAALLPFAAAATLPEMIRDKQQSASIVSEDMRAIFSDNQLVSCTLVNLHRHIAVQADLLHHCLP